MPLPFLEHVGAQITECGEGKSVIRLEVQPIHFNSHGVVHGAALFTLADTGMGAALFSTLGPDERCSTIEVKINYFKPVLEGTVECRSHVLHRGRRVANLECTLTVGGALVGKASGSFAIFIPRQKGAA
jgi:acyl-CoA thioesterase